LPGPDDITSSTDAIAVTTVVIDSPAVVEEHHPRTFWIIAGMMLVLFLAALDQTIVATAAPSVVSALGGFNLFAWVFAAYMLASTAVTPIAGKLSDTYGRRWVYLIGFAVFMVGSALSGASQSMEWLIFSRGVQGLGAEALFPVSMATIADLYPPAKRARCRGSSPPCSG
jgi:MFS family permease